MSPLAGGAMEEGVGGDSVGSSLELNLEGGAREKTVETALGLLGPEQRREGFEGAVGCCTGGCGCCPPIPLMAFIIGPVELLGILDGEPRLRRTVSRTGPQAGQFGSLHLR